MYDHHRCMYYDHRACKYIDHSTCMYCDHSTCMYYEHSTCMYYVHSTCMYYDHSPCMYYVHSTCMYYDLIIFPLSNSSASQRTKLFFENCIIREMYIWAPSARAPVRPSVRLCARPSVRPSVRNHPVMWPIPQVRLYIAFDRHCVFLLSALCHINRPLALNDLR